MSGYFATDSAWWPMIADSLPKPWPREACLADLRWWADQVRTKKAPRIPGRPALRERWGADSDWQVRAILKAEEEWSSPLHGDHSASPPPAGRQPAASRPPVRKRSNAENETKTASPPPANRQPAASEPPHAYSSYNREQRAEDKEGREGSEPNPTSLPAWLVAVKGLPRGSKPRFLDLLVKAHTMVFDDIVDGKRVPGKPPDTSTLKTFSGPVVSLWRARGWPDVETFGRDLLLLVDAAKRCPDQLFSNDIRWEGTGKKDRSRDIGTICVHERFDVRIDAARRWKRDGAPSAVPQANGNHPAAVSPFDVVIQTANAARWHWPTFESLLPEPDRPAIVAAIRATGFWRDIQAATSDRDRRDIRTKFDRAMGAP